MLAAPGNAVKEKTGSHPEPPEPPFPGIDPQTISARPCVF
jgi:hypothetical protein